MHTIHHDWDVKHSRTTETILNFTVRCGDGAPMKVYLTEAAARRLVFGLVIEEALAAYDREHR